jgi:hypothetical protein
MDRWVVQFFGFSFFESLVFQRGAGGSDRPPRHENPKKEQVCFWILNFKQFNLKMSTMIDD